MSSFKSITLAFIGAAAMSSCSTLSSKPDFDNAASLAREAIPLLQASTVYSAVMDDELVYDMSNDKVIFIMAGNDSNNDNILQEGEVTTASLYMMENGPKERLKSISLLAHDDQYTVRNLDTDESLSTKKLSTALGYMNKMTK